MEVVEDGLEEYFAALYRRKWLFVGMALLILVVAVSLAFGLPAIYRSTATILVEQQDIPYDLVRTTITSYADERIQILGRRVKRRSNLSRIIEEYDLYSELTNNQTMDALVDRMRENINVEMESEYVVDPRSGRTINATIAFGVSFEHESPELAQKVTRELADFFLEENLRERAQLAAGTSSFLEIQAGALKTQIAELEKNLAEFKQRHAEALPELFNFNMQRLEQVEGEMEEVKRDIRSREEQKAVMESELAYLSPYAAVYSETGERVFNREERLKFLQTQYVNLSASYEAGHPDMVRVRREIEALGADLGVSGSASELENQLVALQEELARAKEKYSNDHPDVRRLARAAANVEQELNNSTVAVVRGTSKPDNPAYLALKTRVGTNNIELEALRERFRDLRNKGLLYEERLTQTPQVERDYLDLTRDYDNARNKYQELKTKQAQAELAESLESEELGERFTLIERANLPQEPVKPNRLGLLMLGVVVSFAGGLGAASAAEYMDNTVRGRKALIKLLNEPPLAVIPNIETKADVRRKIRLRALIVSSLIVTVLLVHWLILPLDEAWSEVIRQLGLEESPVQG